MKKLVIALVLTMVMVLSLSAPVLAWDNPDPSVADNKNFQWADGYDSLPKVWVDRTTSVGEQHPRGLPADGKNVYRDDFSNAGNLYRVEVNSITLDLIDLPNTTSGPYPFKWDESPNNPIYYFATEPGGSNNPEPIPEPIVVVPPPPEKHYLIIVLPDGRLKVERKGTMRYTNVDFNDGVWRIQIWSGTRIWNVKGGAAHKLYVEEDGSIRDNVWFMRGEPIVTRM